MPNPTAVYTVFYDGQQLPGYVQTEDRPISLRHISDNIYGRDGILSSTIGANAREIGMNFLLMSDAGANASGLTHLDNVMDQYREALKILTREPGMKQLTIHDADRYYVARVDSISAPLDAGQSRAIRYSVDFTAQPWAYATTATSSTFTANGAVNLALGDSRRAYPVFVVPAGVTHFVATDENGKVLSFTRGTASGTITIDCGELTAVSGSGVNAIITIDDLDFGLHYKGTDGTYTVTISEFTGTGTVDISIRARYEL